MVPYAAAAADRQPQLLDPECSKPEPLARWNGRLISPAEACQVLRSEAVELVVVTAELVFVLDLNRKLRQPCLENLVATSLWYKLHPAARGLNCISGRAILCHATQIVLPTTRR